MAAPLAEKPAPQLIAVHSLPFRTEFRGTTNISDNFKPSEGAQPVAHFRGRRLLGTVVEVPATHIGCVATVPKMIIGVKRPARNDEEEAASGHPSSSFLADHFGSPSERYGAARPESLCGMNGERPATDMPGSTRVTVLDHFERFVVWEHDRAAVGAERAPLSFISVARVLHAPVPYAPVDASMDTGV
jgi:hypothetical protein